MTRRSATTLAFEALSAPYRRQLLLTLLASNPQSDDDLDPLNLRSNGPTSDGVDADRLELVHNHLPRLDESGYIEWEQETGQITKGSNWNDIAPLLRLIDDHREELPDGRCERPTRKP